MTDLWEPVSGVFWRSAPLLPDFGWSVDFSSLFINVVGALAGAGVGAWAAGRIAERNKFREQLTKEIRDANAAMVLALGIVGLGVNFKKQHAVPLQEDYKKQRKEVGDIFDAHAAGKQSPQISGVFVPTIEELTFPIDYLQDIVLGRLSNTGRLLAGGLKLKEAVTNLNWAIKRRGEILKKITYNELPAGARVEHILYGLPYGDGHVNKDYSGTVEDVGCYTDDVIFFSSLLCADIYDHANFLSNQFSKRVGGEVPEINGYDISADRRKGWIPDSKIYESWMSSFKTVPQKEPRRWSFRWRTRL